MPSTLLTCTESSRPASPSAGDTLFETDTNKVIVYDGSAWKVYNSDNAVGYNLDGTNITSVAPLFHFDAEKINGTDATGNPANAASFTGQWTSRANGVTTVAQGTASAQPTYYTAGENSKAYLSFDGGDSLDLTRRAYFNGDFTLMIVGKGTGSYFAPLGSAGTELATPHAFDMGGAGPFSGRSGDYLMFYSDASPSGYPGVSSFPTGKNFTSQTRNLIFKRASSSASLFFDGNNIGSTNPTTNTSDVDVRVGVIGRGSYVATTGNIYEIIAFESALSSADLNKWNAYVTAKYAAGSGAMESQVNF
jgi:hypothetical protein